MSLRRLFLAARLVLMNKSQSPIASRSLAEQGADPLATQATTLAKSDDFGRRSAIHATTLAKSDEFGQPFFRRLPAFGALCVILIAFAMTSLALSAQSTSATVNGQITDPNGKVVPATAVQAVNIDTNISYPSKTNDTGIYVIPNLPPGRYRLVVTRDGFKQVNKTDIALNVQDNLEQNFSLEVGSTSESVTVEGGGVNINTTDGSVSTVVDRQFVENMPLNGRSLQSLITLAPGVLVVPSNGVGASGEFSINGQRTEANYFSIDGVSANTGSTPLSFNASGTGGNVAGETALGTTQSMISLDALQEFRATTSTYSAEYGRTPGGQFSFVSRSGGNDWHGSAFDYFRNEALDANNWYSNAAGVPRTPERQNDFGGTLGGPIRIPRVYNGRDKTFFFFSYEGLRLQLPAGAVTDQYPDMALRTTSCVNACVAIKPFLNAFPVPNGPEVLAPCDPTSDPTCPPSGQKQIGLALFTAAYSNPSSLDAVSIRVDHNLTESMKIFGRYSYSPSSSATRSAGTNLANSQVSSVNVKSFTLGTTNIFSPRLTNDFRLNYTRNNATSAFGLDNFGDARPIGLSQFLGSGATGAPKFFQFSFLLFFGAHPNLHLGPQQDAQQQWNLVDAFTVSRGSHNLKFGIDYRRLSTFLHNRQLEEAGFFFSENDVTQDAPTLSIAGSDALIPPEPIYTNFSAYAQDDWKISHRLSLSLGLRWDVNPPPGSGNGILPYTLDQIMDLNSTKLAPAGTPLWHTDYHAFAPRVGASYLLRQSASTETVIRGGFGIFYDIGNVLASDGFSDVGFGGLVRYFGVPFPLTSAQLVIPPASTSAPYDNTVSAFDPHLKLPHTMQWNLAMQQALGSNQALTLTYVGAAGRNLLFTSFLFPPTNSNFSSGNGLQLTTGKALSDYDALQAQFQKKISHGLQALASYTWSHSIDDGSSNFGTDQLLRGSSDFDVRHNFQLALTYDLPGSYLNPALSAILKHWGLDTRVSARTGLPVDIFGGNTVLPNGQQVNLRPDLVPNVPIYLSGTQYPGGRIINCEAFIANCDPNNLPASEGDLPRNFARNLNTVQTDLALRRDFPIHERLRLQFRAEAFNMFNHANFSNIDNNLGDGPFTITPQGKGVTFSGFGGAQSTANNSLGGLNPLYQVGGPRSLQMMLKLDF